MGSEMCIRDRYKKQAHLHDVIYPYVHQDAQTVTVGLCDEAGKPYAVLSHRAADSGSDKAAEKREDA